MATKTTNYGLTKPGTADNALISDINGNMDIIDQELKKRIEYEGDKLPGAAMPVIYKELVRFTANGTFAPSEYPTADGRYDILLQGGGGSGAYSSSLNDPRGGESGGFLSVHGVPLRSDGAYTVAVGAGGAAVYNASVSVAATKGKDGGDTSFAGYTAKGGRGGVYGSTNTEFDTPTVSNNYTHNTGTEGSGGKGGDSFFAAGGKNNLNGSGGAGSLGSGGGAGYKSGSSDGTYTSGKGGDGVVIICGWTGGR